MVNFYEFLNIFFVFLVVIFDLAHGVEAIFRLMC